MRKDGLGSNAVRGFLLLCVLVPFADTALAQRDMGSIAGTVTDPTGAPVPGAAVTVTEVDKQISYQAVTNAVGEYVVTALPVGRYSAKVEKAGFKTALAGPIRLDVQQRAAINCTLQIGEVTQTIQVSGIAPQLETQTSSLGQVIDSREMEALP